MSRVAVLLAALAAVTVTGCGQDEPDGPPVLGYGEAATVQVDAPGGRVEIEATVQSVEAGSAQELLTSGLSTGDLAGRSPFYVRVAYVNPTGRAFTAPVQQQLRPVQSDGAYAQRLTIVGRTVFGPCSNPTPPDAFDRPGGTAGACIVTLADPGTTVTGVEWTFPDRTTEAVWQPVA